MKQLNWRISFFALIFFFASCESEEITPVETTTEAIVGTPITGIPFAGESEFNVFIEGEEFLYNEFRISYLSEEDESIGFIAHAAIEEEDGALIELVQLTLPLTAIYVGDHAMYFGGPYQVIYYHDDFSMNTGTPALEENVLTITAFDSSIGFISGNFSTSANYLDLDGNVTAGVAVENISGEFAIYY